MAQVGRLRFVSIQKFLLENRKGRKVYCFNVTSQLDESS